MATTTIGSYIPISTANTYITKFIADYFNTGKFPAKSFILDAKMICDFIKEHQDVQNIKFMLGKTPAGTLTLVVAGVDAAGNYVTNGSTVLDQCDVCPPQCPSGTAGNDTI